MKKQRSANKPSEMSPSERIGRLFDLLLRIDKRINPGFYENNKDRNRSYTPEGGPDGLRIGRDR